MKYLLLIYEPHEEFLLGSNEHDEAYWAPWRAYHKAMIDAGVLVDGYALHPDLTATTFRVRGGQRQVQDGPYADTKEQLGGYVVLDLPSLDAALEWSARCPAAASGAIEIRPIFDRYVGLAETS